MNILYSSYNMATTSSAKIILAIYTSNDDVPRTKHLYNTYWKDSITSNIQIVLVYEGLGTSQGTEQPYTFINGTQEQPQHLVLDSRLTHRTLEMFRAIRTRFPTMVGCFKCDDTVIPNVLQLQGLLNFIGSSTIDYLGKVNPESGVCCPPMYYLSRRAIVFLDTLVPKTDVRRTVDFGSYAGVGTREVEALDILDKPVHQHTEILIADHLRKMGVSPDDYNQLYSENIQDMNTMSINLTKPLLYVKIDGGIGNQLFQIASAYGIAMRAGMEMSVIAYGCHSTHIPNPYDYFQTIFKNVPHTYHNHLAIQQTFQEPERACWSHIPDIVETMSAQNTPTLLRGYFQNLSYFREYQDDIRAMFLRQDILDGLTKRFDSDPNKSLAKSYFLHIRRGDYVNNHRYWIDSDKYYRAAIDHILAKHKRSSTSSVSGLEGCTPLTKEPDPHFYIFSNDIEYCKQYHVLGSYQEKTFVDNLGEVESLYLMSLCQRGGICANSTYSWWGAYLNNHPEKTIIFPKRWFNLPEWPFDDIFLEGSIVLES